MADAYAQFRSARDFLLSQRTDYDRAVAGYDPPRIADFNWALDWFDQVAADPTTGPRAALRIVEADGTTSSVTYAEMSARSSQVASWLSLMGAAKGDRLLLMLGNQVELWETLLACIKLGVVVIPATTLLTPADLDDRITRGDASRRGLRRYPRRLVGRSGGEGSVDRRTRSERGPRSFCPPRDRGRRRDRRL